MNFGQATTFGVEPTIITSAPLGKSIEIARKSFALTATSVALEANRTNLGTFLCNSPILQFCAFAFPCNFSAFRRTIFLLTSGVDRHQTISCKSDKYGSESPIGFPFDCCFLVTAFDCNLSACYRAILSSSLPDE